MVRFLCCFSYVRGSTAVVYGAGLCASESELCKFFESCSAARTKKKNNIKKTNHVNDDKFFINLFMFSTILWSPCGKPLNCDLSTRVS